MSDQEISQLFEQARTSYSEKFLEAEEKLITQGQDAVTWLEKKCQDRNLSSFDKFLASTLSESVAGKYQDYQKANDAVDKRVTFLEKTPVVSPPPDAMAGILAQYQDVITNIVALHLVKELNWKIWQTQAAIIYLGYYGGASVLPAFDQFMKDLKAGKRGEQSEILSTTGAYLEQLAEAMNAVRVVIENDAFEESLNELKKDDTAKNSEAAKDAAVVAVHTALSVLTADPKKALQLNEISETLITEFLLPILGATEGSLDDGIVRGIFAKYVLGGDVVSTEASAFKTSD